MGGGDTSGGSSGSNIFNSMSAMATPQPTAYPGVTIPQGGAPIVESDDAYFEKLMNALYDRMAARAQNDPGEIGYAPMTGTIGF